MEAHLTRSRRDEGNVECFAFKEFHVFFGAKDMNCEAEWHQNFKGVFVDLVRCMKKGLNFFKGVVRNSEMVMRCVQICWWRHGYQLFRCWIFRLLIQCFRGVIRTMSFVVLFIIAAFTPHEPRIRSTEKWGALQLEPTRVLQP